MNSKNATSPSRKIANDTVLAMLGCPAKGYKHHTVAAAAIIDSKLMAAAVAGAIKAGHSFTFVHVPVEWDVSQPLIAHAITALDIGMRLQRDPKVWLPAGRGPALLVGNDGAYQATKDGLVRVALPLGLEATMQPGFSRGVRRLLAALSCALGVSLAA